MSARANHKNPNSFHTCGTDRGIGDSIAQPAPIVTINVDPTPVTFEVPSQPDKIISFSRNVDGEIIQAETTNGAGRGVN
jgi:hypothetical protein